MIKLSSEKLQKLSYYIRCQIVPKISFSLCFWAIPGHEFFVLRDHFHVDQTELDQATLYCLVFELSTKSTQ